MNSEMVFGFIRHALTFGGGYFVAKGYFDEATMNEIVGGLATLIGAFWSVWQKRETAD